MGDIGLAVKPFVAVIHCRLTLFGAEPAEMAFIRRDAHFVSEPLIRFRARHAARSPDALEWQLATLPGVACALIGKRSEWDGGERVQPNISTAILAEIDIWPVAVIAPVNLFMSSDSHCAAAVIAFGWRWQGILNSGRRLSAWVRRCLDIHTHLSDSVRRRARRDTPQQATLW